MTQSGSMNYSAKALAYLEQRRAHWNNLSVKQALARGLGRYYRRWIVRLYQFLIPRDATVLEIGCAEGDLLAALAPSRGVGVDFSNEMLKRARQKHPHLQFENHDAHDLQLKAETFDYIVISDLLNDVWDVQRVVSQLRQFAHPGTRLILNSMSHSWEFPIRLARLTRHGTPMLPQNWLTVSDIDRIVDLAGFEVFHHQDEMIWPFETALLAEFLNRYVARIFPFYHLTLSHFFIARPTPLKREEPARVSIVVAARNEAGNIQHILERVPELGGGTELIFVEGGSSDDTYAVIDEAIKHSPLNCQLHRQTGIGKGDAVRTGFAHATGEVLMILDADLTVQPEDLERFYDALLSGKGEFINGVRLVYPLESEAMRFFNVIGNKFFSLAFSWLLGQSIRDTLCGTKVLWRKDYEKIAANRNYFGEFDPFGDFDLLFGAARLNRRIIDLPVRYQNREYGETNIQRWRHGVMLLRMVVVAARKIKFV